MVIKYWKQIKLQLTLVLGFSSLSWMNLDLRLFAQTNINSRSQDINDIEGIILVSGQKQPQPPNLGTPTTTRGTGTRGNCSYKGDSAPLTSLVGNDSLTKTLKKYPSFWIYIPYSVAEVSNAEFTLQDGENDLYRSSLKMPADIPGIVEIKLPETVSPLKTGKSYRWYFEINCPSLASNSGDLYESDTLTGIVEKVAPPPELKKELQTTTATLERTKILAKHGIWHDALTEIAKLRLQNPQQISYQKLWNELLSQPHVGLSDVSSEKIVGTVQQLN